MFRRRKTRGRRGLVLFPHVVDQLAVCPRTTIKMSSPVKRRSSGGVNKSRAAGNATVTSSSKKAGDRDARKARKAKFAEPERSPLAKLILSIFGFWAAIGGIFILHGLASGTLLPDWAVTLMNPGELTMELIEDGDGEHRAVAGDEVQIEYTATVTATGKTFDSSQGRGPMKFEVGAEPPKALIALDMAVQNMVRSDSPSFISYFTCLMNMVPCTTRRLLVRPLR